MPFAISTTATAGPVLLTRPVLKPQTHHTMNLQAKLKDLGLTLPPSPKAVAAYVPAVRTGDLIIVSGQLPIKDGQLTVTGPVPSSTSLQAAQTATRQCVLNALAAVDPLIDHDWSRLVRVVRVGVFVASDPTFTEQHLVANGASELLFEIFGEAGRHARAAVGVPCLPLGASVEVEFIFEVR
jgi:enamine deaminase RidA (YjgF/YER057c/UK114 family)